MTVQPATLFDPVVGNIGLFTDHAVIALRCDEPDGVLLSDELGNLGDLHNLLEDFSGPDTTTAPTSERAWAGSGRRFVAANSNAGLAGDAIGRDTLLLRDATVQAIVSLRWVTSVQTLVARGTRSGAAAEALGFALELEPSSGGGDHVDVRWLWEDYGGTIRTQTAGTFQRPANDAFFLITATRRWEAVDRVVLRYYIGEQLLAEVVSTDGEIAGGTTGHTMVGGRKSGGVWSKFLNGCIDELVVTDHEMSADEVREVWRRLTEYQPGGVETFAGLSPPGAPWYRDPGNRIGRKVKVAGQMLGIAVSKAEELRAMFLADRASVEVIGRWEHLCNLAPRPRDSLDVRRARVVAYLSRLQGYSIPAIQQAASTVVDQDADDVELLEFTNTITDDFTTLKAERWLVGPVGTWAVAAGKLTVSQVAGADLRWDPTLAPCYVRTPLAGVDGNVLLQGKLAAFWAAPALPTNTIVGLFLYNRRSNNALWFGVKNVAGVYKVGYAKYVAGVLGAFVVLDAAASSAPYWLRIAPPGAGGSGFGGSSTYVLSWSTTGPTSGFTDASVNVGFHDFEWAGFAAMCTAAATATDLAASFDDIVIRTPNGDRPFCWYLYRDPLLAGTPDMIGAQILTQKVKPAHTYAAAITSKSVLCDDPVDGLCDRGPLGAL